MNATLDLDLSDPDSFAAGFPHEYLRQLRAEDPVHWHEGDVHGGPGYWIVSKYDDLKWGPREISFTGDYLRPHQISAPPAEQGGSGACAESDRGFTNPLAQ